MRCPKCFGAGRQTIKAKNTKKSYRRRCIKCRGTGELTKKVPWFLRAGLGEESDNEIAQCFRRPASLVSWHRRRLGIPVARHQQRAYTLDSCVVEALDRFNAMRFKDVMHALENNYGSCGERRLARALVRLTKRGEIVHDKTGGRSEWGYKRIKKNDQI